MPEPPTPADRDHSEGAGPIPAAPSGLGALAGRLRELIAATVESEAPAEAIAAAIADVEAAIGHLRPHVPDPPPPRYPSGPGGTAPEEFFPFDFVLGPFNPIAAPIRVEWHAPLAIGRVVFGTAYEGPPGCVHGGVIAASFDQVLNVANLMSGIAGPTRSLEIRYRKPTPLRREIVFEGRVESVEGREVRTSGRILVDDVVTAEALGVFVQIPIDRILRMLDQRTSTE